ncbi:MAG TPA: hypothetical protein VFO50_04685 [Candidatus Limnocylindrales bacterium]|nr:hypothetical protein [Candidatus Limnocylindrales bacterium]
MISRPERQQLAEPVAQRPDRGAVRARVGQEEDQVTVWVIAVLQGQATFERLAVADVCFRLDPSAPGLRPAPADLGIPRAEIAVRGERNLRAPAQVRMDAGPEPVEQRQLRPIPDRIPGRVRPQRAIQPDHGAIRSNEFQRWVERGEPLKAAHRPVRNAEGIRHDPLAEPGSNTRGSCVDRDAAEGFSAPPASAIRWAFSGPHDRGLSQGVLYWRLLGPLDHPVFQAAEERAESVPVDAIRRPLDHPVFQARTEPR